VTTTQEQTLDEIEREMLGFLPASGALQAAAASVPCSARPSSCWRNNSSAATDRSAGAVPPARL
jgi:hypothetical protein